MLLMLFYFYYEVRIFVLIVDSRLRGIGGLNVLVL